MDVFTLIVYVTLCLVSTLLLLVTWDVRAKRAHADQPLRETLRHYLSINALWLLGSVFRYKLIRGTRRVEAVQKSFLLAQLRENAGTVYGREHSFSSVRSVEDFRRLHPLTRYDHYAAYVQRMMEGEENVLTKQSPDLFGVSSGTNGEGSKLIPMLKKQRTLFFLHAVAILYCCLVETYPASRTRLRKTLKIFYDPTWRRSKSGVKIGPNSSTPSSQKGVLHMYSTPAAGFLVRSEPDALYVHLLFALRDRHLGMLEGNFASLIHHALTTLQARLRELTEDVELGSLSRELDLLPDVRAKLEALLRPDPDRARDIRRAMDEGVVGAVRRLWPEMNLVLSVDTGAFAPYAARLRETWCQGVPLYSPVYAATEGLIGVNLWPAARHPARYLPHPAVQFFEFVPADLCHLDQPETLLLHQVEDGKEYELVLTNVSGLYRYRLGDVVRVRGFLNQCPILEFLYRVGQFLNVRGEKTCESMLYEALCEAVAQWSGLALVDYCCAENIMVDSVLGCETNNRAPCYHVFLEMEAVEEHIVLSEDQKRMIDESLSQKSYAYSSFRKKGSIDVIQVHVVQRGAFRQLRDYVINTTEASSNQFKVPRVLKHEALVKFLLCRKVL